MSAIVDQNKHFVVPTKVARPIIDGSFTGGGTLTRRLIMTGTSLIGGLHVESITGSLTITVSTYDGDDESTAVEILSWDSITAPTSEFSNKLSKLCLSRVIVTATYTGDVSFRLAVKSIDENPIDQVITVTLDQATGFSTREITVGDTTPVMITSASASRSIAIRNWDDADSTAVLYVKEDATDITEGWPLVAREGLSLDIDAGSSFYLLTDGGSMTVKILDLVE